MSGPRFVNGQAIPHPVMRVLKGIVLAVACALVLIPFLGIVSTSLASQADLNANGGFVLLPSEIDLTSYRAIFAGGLVTRAIAVSAFITIAGTAVSLLVSTLLAYALAQPKMTGRGLILGLVLLSLLFSPGMIPLYLTVRGVGLLDNLWSLILPVAVSGFNVVVLRAFFMGVPGELLDSARIDGAPELMIFRRIVLPLSKAVLAVIALFYAVGYWNAFFNALLYITDSSRWPLQLVLRTYVVNDTQIGAGDLNLDRLPSQASLQMAILVVSIVPILCVYPFLQRHFAKGVLTGAVKG